MAINPVQGGSNQDFTGASIASLQLTFGTPVAANSLVCGHGTFGPTTHVPLVNDNQSNSYTVVLTNGADATNNQAGFLFYKEGISNAPTTFTLTFVGGLSPNYVELTVEEFSGVATSSAATGTFGMNVQNSPGTGTNAVTSPSITPAVDGCLIYGFTQNDGGSTLASAGTGYTSGVSNATAACRSEYKVQTTAAAVAATFTVAANESHITGVMAFKPAAGGGGSATTVAAQASYAFTPQSVGTSWGHVTPIAQASYAFTPQNVGTSQGGNKTTVIAQATYSFTPQPVGTARTRTVDVTYLSVPGNEGYRIEWDSNSGEPYANSAEVATDVLTYAITGLAERTTYYWRVAALVAGEPQTWSNEEVFTTSIDPMVADAASYTFTPQDVGLIGGFNIASAQASYAFTPQPIGTSKGGNQTTSANSASYAFTPQNVGTAKSNVYSDTIDQASYVFTPQNVATSRTVVSTLAANSASYAWTPRSVGTSTTGTEDRRAGFITTRRRRRA
ncbi:MAG: fibronectin type III domain-containing protein [Rhizobiales bacterium]|nr:fibronectin type III domain-containing protein [Hyphomicrobiales bacterium]